MKTKDFGRCQYCNAKLEKEIEAIGEICDTCLRTESKKLYRK